LQNSKMQLKEQILAKAAEGMSRFAPLIQPTFVDFSQLQGCTRCSLGCGRVHFVLPKKADVFVLAEAPTPSVDAALGEEPQKLLFEMEKSTEVLLSRLLQRLPQHIAVHRSYGLKCLPRKGLAIKERGLCARKVLALELEAVKPKLVFAFGNWARFALLESNLFSFSSNTELAFLIPSAATGPFGSLTTVVFPSVEELTTHPSWRAEVWEKVQTALGGLAT
jgi:uracil-DNA glycosylase